MLYPQHQPAARRIPHYPSLQHARCFSINVIGLLLMLMEENKYNVGGKNEQADGPNQLTTYVHSFSDPTLLGEIVIC